jgi:hypothetical protein
MLDLTEADANALMLVVLRVDKKSERYGAAHQLNWTKVGLSRAYFVKYAVCESSLPSAKAVAAFRFLMANNKYYKSYHQIHQQLLQTESSLNISSYDLFVQHVGIECAMCPVLYPTTDFTDTGILQHYQHQHGDNTNRVCSIGLSWTRKALSSVRVYSEQVDLPFFLYEKHLAAKFFFAQVRAKRMGVTGDVMTRDSQASAGYWEIVQDALSDLVRIMLVRCFDEENYPILYNHCKDLRGQVWLCAFPNLFITIAPAEWKFPRPYFLEPYINCIFAGTYLMALHMYYLMRCVLAFLVNPFGHRFFVVLEWVCKTEYQGRKTPHWHIAAWVVCYGRLALLQGRTGTAVISAFVKFLAMVFMCEVDVQVGNGRLNYINGYVSKDHDAVDVGLGEYTQKNACSSWLAAYRLMSKCSPGLPEVAIRMAQLPEFDRSYSHVLLYPPQPSSCLDYEGRQTNFSSKMYGFYLQEKKLERQADVAVSESFITWHRSREYDSENKDVLYRGGRHQQSTQSTLVVACRFWYELTDGYWGQFSITMFPHADPKYILPQKLQHLQCMQNFAGMLEYLCSWHWSDDSGVIIASDGYKFMEQALPMRVDDGGMLLRVGVAAPDALVFPDVSLAYEYAVSLARRDLQYRGMRDDRVSSFEYKQRANFLLFEKVRDCSDQHEYQLLRQSWDTVNRPKYRSKEWSPEQQEVLDFVSLAVSFEDEEAKRNSYRWLYVPGPPGSGKSEVMLEAAIRLCKTMQVVIVCPTGFLVFAFKSRLPDMPGIENIRVDTIQGLLNYKRPGPDSKVRWAPPSALRSIDAILIDECSQYEDEPWERLYKCVKEQPHFPLVMCVADFQQLQPVVCGGLCKEMCELMKSIELKTVYRSSDPEHLLFLNRIRSEQPTRDCLEDYFDDRHWHHVALSQWLVARLFYGLSYRVFYGHTYICII